MKSPYFKKRIKKLFKTRGKDVLKNLTNPYRDWKLLLSIFFVMFVVLVAVNAFLFIKINEEDIFSKEDIPMEKIEMLDTGALAQAIDFFSKRGEEFNNRVRKKPEIVDPSR